MKKLNVLIPVLLMLAAVSISAQELPKVDPSRLSGNIITAGSSTVYPLSEKMAERFKKEGFQGNVTIDMIGSGAGFERFCKTGETDIANASRPIKSSEIESAGKLNPPRTPIGFQVGIDALAVVISKKNTFLKNATMEELALIFSSAENWSDVNPAWPKKPIRRFIPGTDSGTFDYFVEAVFKNKKEPILAAKNLQLSEDDNVLVRGVMKDQYAIGFFGYAYFEENRKTLNAISIKGVNPDAQSVVDNTYALARPLFIYSSANIMKEKPQVAAFINYYITNVDKEIKKVGYFPATKEMLDKSKKAWLDAMK